MNALPDGLGSQYPVCPYCGESDYDIFNDTAYKADGQMRRHECPNCDKEFMLAGIEEITFHSESLEPAREMAERMDSLVSSAETLRESQGRAFQALLGRDPAPAREWYNCETCGQQVFDTPEETEIEQELREYEPTPDGLEYVSETVPGFLKEQGARFGAENCPCHLCAATRGEGVKRAHGIMWHAPGSRMVVCPECGNKRCPKASNHDLGCTGSNEPGQEGSVYA